MIDQYQKKFAVISFNGAAGKFIGTFTELRTAEAYVDFTQSWRPERDVRVFEIVEEAFGYPAPTESEVHGD